MSDIAAVPVATSNTAQLTAWDGTEGQYWASHADDYDSAIAGYHQPLLELAAIGRNDTVLDIGCGTGQTTRDAARLASAGSAVGIDLSSAMLDVARARAEQAGLPNVSFLQADAQVHRFEPATFDVAISRTGTMFFGDPAAAYANIAAALRPGGRVAFAVWQDTSKNEWFTAFTGALSAGRDLPGPPPEAPHPFSMSDPDRVSRSLADAGFGDLALSEARGPMTFGATAGAAHDFVLGQLGWLIADLDEPRRRTALLALMQTMQDHESSEGVEFGSAMWLISARRS
jgi:SAM-dependent methyltransferase